LPSTLEPDLDNANVGKTRYLWEIPNEVFPFFICKKFIFITEVRFRSLPETFKRYIGGTTLYRYIKQRCNERRNET